MVWQTALQPWQQKWRCSPSSCRVIGGSPSAGSPQWKQFRGITLVWHPLLRWRWHSLMATRFHLSPASHCQAPECRNTSGREDLPEGCRNILPEPKDRKSTRLNSSHVKSSYAVVCLEKNRDSVRRAGDVG